MNMNMNIHSSSEMNMNMSKTIYNSGEKMNTRKRRNKRKNKATPIPHVDQGTNKYANAVPADLYDLDDDDDFGNFNINEQNLMCQAVKVAEVAEARRQEAQERYRQLQLEPTMDASDWESDGEDRESVHDKYSPPSQQGQKEDMVPISSRPVIKILESEFQRLAGEEKEAVRLKGEMAALSQEVNLLKEQLRQQEEKATSEKTRLLTEVSGKLEKAGEAVLEIEKLKEDCETEKRKRSETEECLAQQTELTSRLQAYMDKAVTEVQYQWWQDRAQLLGDVMHLRAALHHAQVTQENQRLLWAEQQAKVTEDNCHTTEPNQVQEETATENPEREEDKTSLLDQMKEELSTVKAELKQTQEDLQTKTCQWEDERSCLLTDKEEICRLKAALEKAEEDLKKQNQQVDVLSGKDGSRKMRASLNQAQKDLKKKNKQLGEERACVLFLKGENGKLKDALAKAQEDQQQWEEERTQLLSEKEDASKLKEVLSQTKKDLKNERKQWEEERTHLLLQTEESSKLKADLSKTQEQLKKNRQQWNHERARIQQKLDSCKLKEDLHQLREQLKDQKNKANKVRADLILEQESLKGKLIQAQEKLKAQDKDFSGLLREKEEERSRIRASLDEVLESDENQKRKHHEEVSQLKSALHQAQEDLSRKTSQWEEDRSQLLAEKAKSFTLETSLNQANDDLERHKLQWQREKASLMESIPVIQQDCEVNETEIQTQTSPPNDTEMDELRRLDEQLEAVRRPSKRSLKKRFTGLFKRDTQTS
ncbi:Hypothetical predicted protein [Xyrichtys novacula]|uniref:Uncharacterized protein n=1 Tax=Xyrichtys novacula TaxID=13765 RepID=A0AAV1ERE4_XYRNO|nr:Hypothetical predicted protein [Xyrichtys novacula]